MLSTFFQQFKFHSPFLAVLIAMILVVYWPLLPLTKIASHLIDGDALHNAYLMNWGQRMLWTNPLDYYDAPMLYPQKTSAAFSSINLFLAFITGPLYFLHKPVFSYNSAMYLAVILCGISMYLTAFMVVQNRKAALVAAILYACNSDLQFHFNGHPNVVSPIFLPPLILIALRLAQRPHYWHGWLFCLFLILQFMCDWYLGFISLLGVGIPLSVGFVFHIKTRWRELVFFLFLFLATMAFLYAFSSPFRAVGERVGSIRGLGSHINYSASLQGYFLPAYVEGMNKSWFSTLLPFLSPRDYRDGDSQFFGWLVYGAFLTWVILSYRRGNVLKTFSQPLVGLLIAVGLTGFLFSLGPYLWFGNRLTKLPLPELALFQFVPPLRFMRDTSRHAVVVVAAMSFLLAILLSHWQLLNLSFAKRKVLILSAILGVMILEFRAASSPQFHVFNKEPHHWLSTRPNLTKVASIPVNNQAFLLQSTSTFPTTSSVYAGGIFNYFSGEVGGWIRDSISDESLALFAEYEMQAVMIYGFDRVQQALKHPALTPLERSVDDNYGLFALNPERISASARQDAADFLAHLTEFPPIANQLNDPQVDEEQKIHLISAPLKFQYHTPYGFAQNLKFELKATPVEDIEGIWAELGSTETGVDYIITKFYTRFENQEPTDLAIVGGRILEDWTPSAFFWDPRIVAFRDYTWSEYQTLVRYIPSNGKRVWVYFDFETLRRNYPTNSLTALRWDLNAMPAPGLSVEVHNAFLVIRKKSFSSPSMNSQEE
ncbi:MAG: hypothetical protein SFY68_11190 [Candidatus Sumerlaeia bacterium]|nr:hypothetical protein [Candidatus Sumerlaeia bacterium]